MKYIALVVIAMCIYSAISGIWMILNLKIAVVKMQNSRRQSYPMNELPIQLRDNPRAEDIPERVAVGQTKGNSFVYPGRIQLDVEEEKYYSYYKRTRNVLSNIQLYTNEQLGDRSWYGYDEWIQDMIANKVEEQILKGNSRKISDR